MFTTPCLAPNFVHTSVASMHDNSNYRARRPAPSRGNITATLGSAADLQGDLIETRHLPALVVVASKTAENIVTLAGVLTNGY